jgi:membrane-anchored glycerophosphoryl diester phosphodiesterase (GDPDase)
LSAVKTHVFKIAVWAGMYALVATLQPVTAYLYPDDILLVLVSGMIFLPVGFVTMFVIPVIILEGKGLAGAVMESLTIIRKTWGEVLLCLTVWMVIWIVVAVAALIPAISIGFPSGNMGLINFSIFLYLLALMTMIIIYTTAAGILVVGLYTYAKTGCIPALFGGKQEPAVFS